MSFQRKQPSKWQNFISILPHGTLGYSLITNRWNKTMKRTTNSELLWTKEKFPLYHSDMCKEEMRFSNLIFSGMRKTLLFYIPIFCLQYMKLLNILHNVKRNEYVVVHGMRGCGKSTLVSSTLHSSASLVLDTFCVSRKYVVGKKTSEACDFYYLLFQ